MLGPTTATFRDSMTSRSLMYLPERRTERSKSMWAGSTPRTPNPPPRFSPLGFSHTISAPHKRIRLDEAGTVSAWVVNPVTSALVNLMGRLGW